MVTTHALAGLALAAGVTALEPGLGGTIPALAAAVGGIVPDLDLPGEHRRTLHFPVYGSLAALPAVGVAALAPSPVTVAIALFVVAFALHAASDALGGGLELRPWEGTSERAVFDHARGRWIPPRRWIRYDGAPEDFLLGIALAVPTLVVFDGAIQTGVYVALAVSAAYALVRKPLVAAGERLSEDLPEDVRRRLPERLREELP
jgi:hypothetical protein